jgi:hypothetical protein
MVVDSIAGCDAEIRGVLTNRILSTGGSTSFRGFDDRLRHELVLAGLSSVNVTGLMPSAPVPAHRLNSAWVGGSLLGATGFLKDHWVTVAEYEETGPSVVHDTRRGLLCSPAVCKGNTEVSKCGVVPEGKSLTGPLQGPTINVCATDMDRGSRGRAAAQ